MIKQVKSIKDLYEEIKDFDIVITADAPLKTAINKIIKKPMLGQLAYTPKEMASKFAPLIFDNETLEKDDLVLDIMKKTGFDLKTVHYYIQQIYEIWQNTGSLKDSVKYLSDEGKKIASTLEDTPTTYLAMEKFDFNKVFKNKKTAVVGIELFNELDKKVLPKDYKKISIILDKEFVLPMIHVFSGEKAIVDRVISMISKDNADNIAIVLNTESAYLPLIKSRLTNKGIPVQVTTELKENFLVRTFLGIVQASMNLNRLYVKEINPYLSLTGKEIEREFSNFLFVEYVKRDKEFAEFYSFMDSLKEKSFKELILWFKNIGTELPRGFIDIIYKLQLIEEKLDIENINLLSYFIENFQIEIESAKSGVLLIDAKNSVFIHKPVCFSQHLYQPIIKNSRNFLFTIMFA